MAVSVNPETPGNPGKPLEIAPESPAILQTLDGKDVSFRFVGDLLYAK